MRHVMNFTDVDDRTILESQKAGVPLREYTGRFIAAFLEDAASSASSRSRRRRARPTRRTSRRWGRRSGARAQRPHLCQRRLDLLQDLDAAGLRQARAPRSRRHQERRAHRFGQVREGKRARFRAVEGDQAGRADLGSGHRSRPSRAGTSSAPRWRCGCSASRRSTFTPAAST